MPDSKRVVLLSGGVRDDSRINIALNVVAASLEADGVVTDLVSLAGLDLPVLGTAPVPPDADDLHQRVAAADAVVAGSAEYHGAPSGGFKNLVDHLTREELRGKPVGLVTVCGAAKGGTNTLNMMRLIFRSLHAPAIVEQAIVTNDDFDGHDVGDETALAYLRSVAHGLVRELGRLP
jgi:NAD(P)H-dependent FMN reductase